MVEYPAKSITLVFMNGLTKAAVADHKDYRLHTEVEISTFCLYFVFSNLFILQWSRDVLLDQIEKNREHILVFSLAQLILECVYSDDYTTFLIPV